MGRLQERTTYYRYDHPDGCEFAAGSDEPSAEDGWVTAPEEIGDPPEHSFECTTLAAYEELLRSERASAAQGQENQARLAMLLQASEGHRMVLTGEVARLSELASDQAAEIARLTAIIQPGEGA